MKEINNKYWVGRFNTIGWVGKMEKLEKNNDGKNKKNKNK